MHPPHKNWLFQRARLRSRACMRGSARLRMHAQVHGLTSPASGVNEAWRRRDVKSGRENCSFPARGDTAARCKRTPPDTGTRVMKLSNLATAGSSAREFLTMKKRGQERRSVLVRQFPVNTHLSTRPLFAVGGCHLCASNNSHFRQRRGPQTWTTSPANTACM